MAQTTRELKEENIEMKEMLKGIKEAISDGKLHKSIGNVVSGPFITGDKPTYRVMMGGHAMISGVWPEITEVPVVGDEVIVGENIIFGVVPKELEQKKAEKVYSLAKWEDIVGLDEELKDVQSSVATLSKDNSLYSDFGVEPIKGILLYGPPGCGKTLIGKAIASDILGSNKAEEGQFFFIKGAEMLDKYVGESERQVTNMFKQARDYTKKTGNKAIIFIDEAEAILGKRSTGPNSFSVVPTFLAEMDGLEANNPFVLLSTNLPDSLDEAIVRDGRIDQRIGVKRPGQEQTAQLLFHYLDKVLCTEDRTVIVGNSVDAIFRSDLSNRISGAMTRNLVNQAAKTAALRYSHDNSTPKSVTWGDMNVSIIKAQ
mgnify:CR=1 FL=1|tara:strand:- start:19111 stop:20223 length:1113 start_codon:yes stop_codon:yes gene_type:complete